MALACGAGVNCHAAPRSIVSTAESTALSPQSGFSLNAMEHIPYVTEYRRVAWVKTDTDDAVSMTNRHHTNYKAR